MKEECLICAMPLEYLIDTEKPEIVCRHCVKNNQCIGKDCPFSAANQRV